MNKLEIYGTFGPSCNDKETIKQLFSKGMTGMRLNLSHCNLWDKEHWIQAFHEAKNELNISADLLIDLKGPELRCPTFDDLDYFPNGSFVSFSTLYWPKEIINNLEVGDHLLIDDGKLELIVKKIHSVFFDCNFIRGGYLYSNKSVAIKGKNVLSQTLQHNDLENLKQAKKYGVTAIMQPFVRNESDLIKVRDALQANNLNDIKIYAKIENLEGFEHLEEIIPYCDCIVIARGDLGNSIGLVQLPIIQHKIQEICKQHNHPFMVVTEMLSSMLENEVPTRAEVNDVFNAVYQGASSIMLTGETAKGKYPIKAMEYFCNIAKEAQNFKKNNS